MQLTLAQDVLDWPIWVYPTVTGADETVYYISPHPDDWLTESWYIPVDFTGGPRTETLYVTVQDRHNNFDVSDVILIVALNPAAYSAISQVDVEPSTEGSVEIDEFVLIDDKGTPSDKSDDNVPRGINVNQHIYKDNPPAQCYFYEFHVAAILGRKGSTSPPDHVDLEVVLHIEAGVVSSEGVYIHFDCSALKNSDIVINPFSHDTNTVAAPSVVHDVAAISQTPSPTAVTQGETVTIDVVVQNQGTQAETFDVTCYFDSGVIDTLSVTDLPAGDYETLIFYWDTTSVPAGTYSIKAWADSGGAITELNEIDNECTATATVTIKVHDVAATSQVPDQITVQQGTTVNIDVTVENLGDFPETFDVKCYYDNTQIGTKTVTNLLAKHSTTLIFSWNTVAVSPGAYYIKAMVDSAHAIEEVDEDNNNCTGAATVTVYVPGEPGELSVDKTLKAVISGPDPPVVGYKTVYELAIAVTNTGGWDVADVSVEDTVSSDVAFEGVGTPSQGSATVTSTTPPKIVWNVGTLIPGASATLTFQVSVTPTTFGLLYLNHKEDLYTKGFDTKINQMISDYGDTDVTVTAIVRDVTAISQVPSSTTVIRGETVSIDVTVQNLGDQTESFDVACYYDSTLIGTLRAYSLSPGSSKTLKFDWDTTGIAPGTYDIKAIVDSGIEIDESDETNNECTNPASVKIVVHDIATISQTPSPTIVTEGETVTVQVVVENQGTESETFTVTLYYDSTQIGTPQTVTNLQLSNSKTLTFNWDTTGVDPGTYYISAVASTVPSETDTYDNSCTSTTTVTVTSPGPPPSRNLKALSQYASPSTVIQGEVVHITVTVKNTGTTTETFGVDLKYNGALLHTWISVTLGPSAQTDLAWGWTTSSVLPGTYSITAVVDPTNAIAETDETDNTCTLTAAVTIQSPPAPPPPSPVGGIWVPINKFKLLAPWITLTSLVTVAAASIVYVKYRKKQQN